MKLFKLIAIDGRADYIWPERLQLTYLTRQQALNSVFL